MNKSLFATPVSQIRNYDTGVIKSITLINNIDDSGIKYQYLVSGTRCLPYAAMSSNRLTGQNYSMYIIVIPF